MEKEKLKIEYIDIKKLRGNKYNPKRMTEKEAIDLEKSITEFGVVDPIIVNKAKGREGILVGGHQRLKIYKKLNFKEVPVVWVDIPDLEKEKELCLRLSKNTGSWDNDLLANFGEEELVNVGWESEELDEIFGLDMDDEFNEKKELEKAVRNPRGVKKGDIWLLGNHKLIVGSCTDKKNWEKLLGKERFDLMETDPPYRIGYGIGMRKQKTKKGVKLKKIRTYPSIGTTDAKGKVKDMNKSPLGRGVEMTRGVPEYDEWLSIANEFQNPVGANVMIFECWRNSVDLWRAIEKYWKIRNQIIWWLPSRNQGFSAKHKFFSKYDIAPLADKGKVVNNEEYEEEFDNYLKEKGQKLLDSYEVILYGNQGKSYWDRKKGKRWAKVTDHITANAESSVSTGQNVVFGTKPVQILVPYIKILSPRNGIVMELFGGSGSTMIACEIMKRKCRMIEISENYSEVIINRFEKFTNIKARKLNN